MLERLNFFICFKRSLKRIIAMLHFIGALTFDRAFFYAVVDELSVVKEHVNIDIIWQWLLNLSLFFFI